jgi:CelD/BcsL family acetyltransferase involved in cellulose biosynthesis
MTRLSVDIKRPSELSSLEQETWRTLCAANPVLGSPYFALEFAECCEEARDDTRVLVIQRASGIVGFLPVQLGKIGCVRPIGGPLGDLHGLICEPDAELDLGEVLAAAHIPMFDFNSGLVSQRGFANAAHDVEGSWIIDLADGFDAWQAARKSVAPKVMRNLRTRRRRLEEVEEGFRFVMADTSDYAFETMIEWKRAQYQRTEVFDVFSVDWTRRLLEAIRRRESDSFYGVCSSLYIGDKIAAVHFGMATDRLCHYWFPAYNGDASHLSPGLSLLVEMAKTAAVLGLQGIELGPGSYGFKKDLASFQVGIGSGYIAQPSLQMVTRQMAEALVRGIETAPLGPIRNWPGKAVRKLDRLAGFYAA